MTEAVRRMTLKQAAAMFFGDARHASTLRVEINRGNLVASKMGRAYWTTLPALQDMEEKCRVEALARNSGGIATEKLGQSLTVDPTVAQGSALRTLSRLKEHFGTTSRESTNRPKVRTRSLPMSSQPTRKNTLRTSSRANTSSTT